ncbi:MAG: glycerate kinase [Bacteroidetes bacterium]|jgi:glycerate kinase|nr:MAG: glycerate kinase [Bacteroidota bacterium]
MQILIAPNAFKHSLSAEQAASAIEKGFLQSKLDCQCELFPVGDGGDGTGELLIKRLEGKIVTTEVHGPLGKKINASFGLIDGDKTAVIEMANASGLSLLKKEELDPLHATSFGTGEQIKAALDRGVKKIIIGMGGSATIDGGTGILRALGLRFLNAKGEELKGGPVFLNELATIDPFSMDKRVKDTVIVVLCDVNNLLLGEKGAAAVFGPQKGASTGDVQILDKALTRFSDITFQQMEKEIATVKHGGTAGGAAAGLCAFLNAKLVNGIEYFLELTKFNGSLGKADLVITGEGSIDEQTLHGKAPYGVARAAKQKGKRVIAFAGKIPSTTNPALNKYFDELISINPESVELETALAEAEKNLIRTATEKGNLLATKNNKNNNG